MKLSWIFCLMILMSISVCFWQCEYLYYREFNEVKDEFNRIEGVEILDIGIGNKDITAEEIYAKIKVDDKIEIGFSSSIYPRCFYEETPVRINEYGEWKFYYFECQGEESNQYDWWSGTFDLGLDGEFNKIANKPIRNIKEAILNYNELESIVKEIPEYPQIGLISTVRRNFHAFKFIYKYKKELKEVPKIKNLNCDSLKRIAVDLNGK